MRSKRLLDVDLERGLAYSIKIIWLRQSIKFRVNVSCSRDIASVDKTGCWDWELDLIQVNIGQR